MQSVVTTCLNQLPAMCAVCLHVYELHVFTVLPSCSPHSYMAGDSSFLEDRFSRNGTSVFAVGCNWMQIELRMEK